MPFVHCIFLLLDTFVCLCCSLCWCLLRYATLHPGGASDDLATIVATLLSMAADRAWAHATPRSLLREELARAMAQLMRGAEKLRPGALALLQVRGVCGESCRVLWCVHACMGAYLNVRSAFSRTGCV